MDQQTGPSPDQILFDHLLGAVKAQALGVAAEVGIADALGDEARSAAWVAQCTGSDAGAIYRLLRMLAGLGIFRQLPDGTFANSQASALLRSGAPMPLRDTARWLLGPAAWKALGGLLGSVRTGRPAFAEVHGKSPFDYVRENPEAGKVFHAMFTGFNKLMTPALAGAWDFSGVRQVADIGGGHGSMLTAILERNPGVTGILFDRPEVVFEAKQHIEAAGVTERIQLVGGDFFDAVPSGADAYLLKYVLHDWQDQDAVRILRNCRRALAAEGRILIIEQVLSDGPEGNFGRIEDIEMLAMTGGKERTDAEWRELLESASLRVGRLVPTPSPYSIIEALPA